MSNKKIAAINIYEVFDNELARMHSLLAIYMQLPKEESYSRVTGPSHTQTQHMSAIYKRIIDMQDILIKQFANHDEIIQNKVAELALTGIADSDTK